MDDSNRLEALSYFLKTKRAQLKPESVSLPPGSRRRTPGLRREEVAQLTGVSTTWYTWLEQGLDIKVSRSVLDCIAQALCLKRDEHEYLDDLALGTVRQYENSSFPYNHQSVTRKNSICLDDVSDDHHESLLSYRRLESCSGSCFCRFRDHPES